jgi:aryl-alcohol dehydrogenase-like predicted oxidoreductase
MRYRTLGDSGLLVSVVGLGCNNFGGRLDNARTRAVVGAAIDEGITLFDTAEMYGRDGGSELAGATSPEQVKTNAAAGEWEPTQDQLAAIDKIVPPAAA